MNNTFYHLKDHSVCPEVNINNNDKHDKQKTTQVLKQPQNNESVSQYTLQQREGTSKMYICEQAPQLKQYIKT